MRFFRKLRAVRWGAPLRSLCRRLGIFNNTVSLQIWLAKDTVEPFFSEFKSWCLVHHPHAGEPDFTDVLMQIITDYAGNLPRVVPEVPDRSNWAYSQHAARFVAQVIIKNNGNGGIFNWTDEDLEDAVWQVYKILAYLTQKWQRDHFGPGHR